MSLFTIYFSIFAKYIRRCIDHVTIIHSSKRLRIMPYYLLCMLNHGHPTSRLVYQFDLRFPPNLYRNYIYYASWYLWSPVSNVVHIRRLKKCQMESIKV